MDEPQISVIVPVYNAENYLSRCLDSILNNSYKNIELILVDDGSVDKSPEICDDYADRDSRIKVIHKENGGTALARNTALKIAQGEYIAFADNDDFIHRDYYKIMVSTIQKTEADIVICELTRDADGFFEEKYDDFNVNIVDKIEFIKGTYVDNWTRNTTPWNKLYKRYLFDDIKFPEGKGYEDAYTTYKLIYKAKRIATVDAKLYCWYNNENSYSMKKVNPKKLLFREEAIRLQTKFYREKDIRRAAEKFYMEQIFFMIYQLQHDYKKTSDTTAVLKQFVKRARWIYYKRNRLCTSKENKINYLELIHPRLGGILRKFLFNKLS